MRIVSLIASSTEIVCALGLEEHLVGRSHECDYPPSVRKLPVCTAPTFPVDTSSSEIDRQVRQIVRQKLSVYDVDAELLDALRPTHIVTQTQCEVCAVSLQDVEEAAGRFIHSRPQIVSLQPNALADVWADIQRVADALEVSARGLQLISSLQSRMASIERRARARPHHPTVACIEWIDPRMSAGNWMPELVTLAGGRNLFGDSGRHSPAMEWDDLTAADPELIAILPCGFDIVRSRQELPALTQKSAWPRLQAVRDGRVYLLDGNQYFNRPGPRLADSLEILAEVFHPEVFHSGQEGPGWQRM